MAETNGHTTTPDVETNSALSPPQPLTNQSLDTPTTELRRSSRQAAKKSGLTTTLPDVGNDFTQRTQLQSQPEGSNKNLRAGSNTYTTAQDVEMESPHHSISINEPAQLNHRASLNKPSAYYLSEEKKDDYMKICVPLHNAALRGDWHAAEEILKKCPEVINMSITQREDTALHIVSSTKHTHFAEKLVNKMKIEDLELKNKDGATAIWLAVASTVEMVDVLLKRNEGLLKIRTKGDLPLKCAVWSGHKDIVENMFSKTDMADEEWNDSDKKSILNSCIALGLYDIALKIITHCKEEGTLMTVGTDVLRYLAYKPAAFDVPYGSRLGPIDNSKGVEIVRNIWGEFVMNKKHEEVLKQIAGDLKKKEVKVKQIAKKEVGGKQIAGDSKKKEVKVKQLAKKGVGGKQIVGDSKKKEVKGKQICSDSEDKEVEAEQIAGDFKKSEGLLFIAARLGNYKFITEILRSYPDIAWDRDENNNTIFHVAVIHRHENVYNLLYELGSRKLGTQDKEKNNILHLAAMKPAQSRLNIVSGAALQMQRELLWFKEVKTRVNSVDRRKWNKEKISPQVLFTKQHADLVKKGEDWMKGTAGQCMVVAALIATIMFAAAFTLPGGNNGDNGRPIFMKKSAFIVFVVADAISLCTSSASILVFLAILTARYSEKDFLVSLPLKLMAGLVTLFTSIATMMIAFSASFFLLYAESMKWIPIVVSILCAVPVILFARLQYRLFFDVIISTLNSRHLFGPKNRMI